MKIIFFLFSTCVFLTVNANASDSDCQKQLQNVAQCVKKKHDDNKDADDAKMEQVKKNVQLCFTQKGCDAPDFNGRVGGMAGMMKQQWDNTPQSVKDCLKKDMKTQLLAKVNECLDKQKIKKIDINDLEANDMGRMDGGDGDKMMNSIVSVGQALKQCEQDHGVQARQGVEDCIKPVVQQIKTEQCKRVSDCKDSVQVTQECRKRAKEIQDGVCKCMKEQLQAARQKIVELQKRGTDVDMDEIKEIAEQSGFHMPNMDKVEQCYKDNNQQLPFELMLFKMGGGPNGLLAKMGKPKITQAQLQDFKNKIDEMLKNDCGCA